MVDAARTVVARAAVAGAAAAVLPKKVNVVLPWLNE